MTFPNGNESIDSEQAGPTRRNALAALALIFLLAALLRFWRLDEIPLGFFRDEAEKGYTAFQLWHTGRQGMFTPEGVETTGLFPAFVDGGSFNFTSAIYQYLSAPFVGIFGLSVLTTRLAAAVCGFFAVVATYFLSRRIESGEHAALWTGPQQIIPAREQTIAAFSAAMFIALSPTHILFSRWAQQGITLPLFASLGMLLLLAAASCERRHQRACALAGGFLMGLTFYAYDPARVVVPLMLLGLWGELGRDFRQLVKIYWPAALVFFIIAIPVTQFAVTTGDSRFARISIFADQSFGAALLNAATNYLKHFDPRFLFLFGDASGRHHLPGSGLIAWGEAPFFLAGLVTLRHWRRPGSRLLLFWLLAAPAAAALTNEGIPHALRSILFFPAIHLVSARGMALVARKMNARHVVMTMAGAAVIILIATLCGLFIRLPQQYHDWQYGVVESLETMWRENPAGPNVLSAEVPFAPYYVLFIERTSPADFQEQGGDAMRTLILVPGSPLPEGALVARPAPIFTRASGPDIPAPYDEGQSALYTVRDQW